MTVQGNEHCLTGSRRDVIEAVVAHVKAKAARTVQSAAWSTVAAVAGVVALVFFLAALFSWLELNFGTIEACLMFGGGFVVIALAAIIIVMMLRRRPTPLNVAAAMPWNDAAVRMGLQAARTLGGRRTGTAGLVGAFVVGIILSRTIGRK
jgi:hypothetical protein